jgi:hypothetical protein
MYYGLGEKQNFYSQSMPNSEKVEESAKAQVKFTNGSANYSIYEQKYNNRGGLVNDPNIAKTALERKYWAIPNIAIGILKTIGHFMAMILLSKSRDLNEPNEFLFSAVRDVEEIYGNFIVIFNDKLGLYHIQKAQFQKYCYHEYGEAPRMMRNPFDNSGNSTANLFDEMRNINAQRTQNTYRTHYTQNNNSSFFREQELRRELEENYKILGLSENASVAEIRGRYKQLSREYHPNAQRRKDNESVEAFDLRKNKGAEKFKDISTAYEVILKSREEVK